MKEIDFIPEWYKASRKRKQRYIRQYTLIGTMFAVMMLWSFVVGGQIQSAGAQVQEIETAMQNRTQWIEEAAVLEQEIRSMQSKSKLLEAISPRTPLSAVVGELSYLVPKDIILSKISMVNELIQKEEKTDTVNSRAIVKVGGSTDETSKPSFAGHPSRMKILISGIAAKPSDAAGMISHFENSDYFDEVVLMFSRPKRIREQNVTEFEIRCYVADYRVVQ